MGRLAPFLTVDDQNVEEEEKRRPPRVPAATRPFLFNCLRRATAKEGAPASTRGGSLLFLQSITKTLGRKRSGVQPRERATCPFMINCLRLTTAKEVAPAPRNSAARSFSYNRCQNVGEEEKRRPPRDQAATLLFFPASLAQKNVLPLKNFLVFGDRLCYNRQLKLVITYV